MSERDDFSEVGHSIRQDNPDNPFLRAATPEVLDANYQRWLGHFKDAVECTRFVASFKRKEQKDEQVDARRIAEARAVVDQIPLTHVMSGTAMTQIVHDGCIKSMAALERVGVETVRGGNTLDIDRTHGLHDFVFVRFSSQPFRIFGIEKAIKLVFDRLLLAQADVFASFEDVVEYHLRQKYMGLESGWGEYLRENFLGSQFPEIATHYIAAAYVNPVQYLEGDRPDFLARTTGQEEFLSNVPMLPHFEVKAYQQLPLHLVREVRINMKGEHGAQFLKQLGLESLLVNDDKMVPW